MHKLLCAELCIFLTFILICNKILKNTFNVLLWKQIHLLISSCKVAVRRHATFMYPAYELDITFEFLITCIMCKNSWSWTAMPLRTLRGINYFSEVLEHIIFIRLHVYLPALNCNTSMSSQLVSDHHLCRIYSTK